MFIRRRRIRGAQGQERRFGRPRSDIERIMRHYGVSEKKARELYRRYGTSILPPRGSGLRINEFF